MHEQFTLKELRREKGLRQEDLSEETGIKRYYISKIETNERRLTMEAAIEIGEVLGLDPAKIYVGHMVKSLRVKYEKIEDQMSEGEFEPSKDIPRQFGLAWRIVDDIRQEVLEPEEIERENESEVDIETRREIEDRKIHHFRESKDEIIELTLHLSELMSEYLFKMEEELQKWDSHPEKYKERNK